MNSRNPVLLGQKISFETNVEDLRRTAIDEARASLDDILAAENLVEKCSFQGTVARLIEIAQAFCCPKHRGTIEMKDFAHSWIAFEYMDKFLESRHWEWDHSQWRCLASDHQEIGGNLKKPDRPERDMVYRSLTQLVVYTAFSDESNDLDDEFLQKAIENLVEKWTCAEHKRNSDIVKAIQMDLEKDIRGATLRSSIHSDGSTTEFQASSNPSLASVSTTFMSVLSPPNSVTSTEDSENSSSDSLRRQSAPTELPSSYSEPKTPERPLPVRSTASDSQASSESSTMNSLIGRTSRLEVSPSPASRTTIEFNKFHDRKKEPQSIFNEVMHIIRQPAKPHKSQNLYEDGWIYILQIPEYKEYVKIGRTTQRMEDRKKQINGCTRGLVIEEIGCKDNTLVSYHERLEAIIFADLYNERCHFHCPCKRRSSRASSPGTRRTKTDSHENDGLTKHGEWFKIDAQEAVRRVQKWRNWMRQTPYEEPDSEYEGELKDDWKRRVNCCEREPGLPDDPAARWQMFMTPFYMTSGTNRRKDRSRSRGVSVEPTLVNEGDR